MLRVWFEIPLWQRVLTALILGVLTGYAWGPEAESIGQIVLMILHDGAYRGFALSWFLVGALLAPLVFVLSALSVPMMLDRPVDMATASMTSIRGVTQNLPAMLLWAALIVAITPSCIKESPPSCLLLHRSMPRFDRRAKDHQHEPEAHARPLGRSRGAQPTPRSSRFTGRCSSPSAPIPAIQVPPSCTLLCRSEPRCDHRVRGSQKRAGPTFRSPRRSRTAQPTPRSPELPGPCSLPSAPTRGRYSR